MDMLGFINKENWVTGFLLVVLFIQLHSRIIQAALQLSFTLRRKEIGADKFRVIVNCRVETHALNSANHLGDLALVDRTKACFRRRLDLSRAGRKFLNEREVLCKERPC